MNSLLLNLVASLPTTLFSIGDLVIDFSFVLKIFVFMTIYQFAKNHVGGGPMGIAVILIFSWFVLFVFWPLFGTLYLLYMLGMIGIGGVIIDFFFVAPRAGEGGGEHASSPVSSGADLAKRMMQMQRLRGPRKPGG